MKRLFCVLFIIAIFCSQISFAQVGNISDSAKLAVQSQIDLINQKIKENGYHWTAGITSKSFLSEDEKKNLCGIHLDTSNFYELSKKENEMYQQYQKDKLLKQQIRKTMSTPNWLNFMSHITDQGLCGDCWAHAAVGVAEGLLQHYLSYVPGDSGIKLDPSYINDNASCSMGCTYGTNYPWCGLSFICSNKCRSIIGSNQFPNYDNAYYTLSSYSQNDPTISDIQQSLQSSPVLALMEVYNDFYSYTEGIYTHVDGGSYLLHAVVILGYDDVNQCWICRNSWGTLWGETEQGTHFFEAGYFRIGYDQCLISYLQNDIGTVTSSDCFAKLIPNLQTIEGAFSSSFASNEWAYVFAPIVTSSNLTIPSGSNLMLSEGSTIMFNNGNTLTVNGTFSPIGTSSIPITLDFCSQNSSTQNGIIYNGGSSGTISYCKIRNAYNGIYENGVSVNISNSAISSCTNGLYLSNSSPTIQSCNIHDNTYAGIYTISSSSPTLYNNYIINNPYGVYCSTSSNPSFGNGSTKGMNKDSANSYGVYCFNNSAPMLGNNSPLNGGYNDLVNTNYNVYNMSLNGVYAINNWWGSSNPGNFKIAGTGAVASSPYQPSSVNPPTPPLSKAGSNLYVSGGNTVPLLSSLDSAYQLIAANNLTGARAICLNMVNNYPDYSLSYNALNLIKETYPASQIDSVKNIYQSLFNNKTKKKIYAMAGLILADVDTANKLNWYNNVINSYSKDSVLELALFDKFVYYNFEMGDKQNALAVSKQLDNLFPLSQGDIGAHIILGDTSYIRLDLSKKPVVQASTVQTPPEYALLDNYPNPFNPSTTIIYQLPMTNFVTLKVYDILGREVKTLVNELQEAGIHSVSFNASNLASGVYFYRLKAGNFVSTKKMSLTK